MKKEPPVGFIFLCSDQTEQECLSRNLFGGTEKYESRVRGLSKGCKVFLYNRSQSTLLGLFEAIADPGIDIEADAWQKSFPYQVRVKRIREYKPVSRYEIPNTLFGFDRANRPPGRLDRFQVEKLEEIFQSEKRIQRHQADRFRADDGHFVKSKAEVCIDNWLYQNRIPHEYEPQIGIYQGDFKIPLLNGMNVYIEYWGLEDEKYTENKNKKLEFYEKQDLKLIELTSPDLTNLGVLLGERLKNLEG